MRNLIYLRVEVPLLMLCVSFPFEFAWCSSLKFCNSSDDFIKLFFRYLQPCPEVREFREDQCAAFNHIPYDGTIYKWYPHYDEDNPCALTCKGNNPTIRETNVNEEDISTSSDTGMMMLMHPNTGNSYNSHGIVVVRLADKVQDGTRCRRGSLDMCIDGICQVS